MITLKDAHQQFVGHLKGRSRAAATILAYGKDIEQLITFLLSLGKEAADAVQTEDLKMFMDKLLSPTPFLLLGFWKSRTS